MSLLIGSTCFTAAQPSGSGVILVADANRIALKKPPFACLQHSAFHFT
jgi:hypothetical protein